MYTSPEIRANPLQEWDEAGNRRLWISESPTESDGPVLRREEVVRTPEMVTVWLVAVGVLGREKVRTCGQNSHPAEWNLITLNSTLVAV